MTTESQPSVQSPRRFRPWLVGGIAVVIAGAAAAAGVFLWQRFSQRPIAPGMAIAPNSALLTLTLPTDPKPWEALAKSGLLQAQPWLNPSYDPLSPEGVNLAQLDYLKDVRPFIGDQATVVLLPITPESVRELPVPPHVWIVPTLNVPMGEQLLQSVIGEPITEINGVKIFKAKGILPDPDSGAIALITHENQAYIIWSQHQSALQQVIATAQANNGIGSQPTYQQAVKGLSDHRPLVELYLNLPAFLASQMAAPEGSLPEPPRELQGMVLTADMTPEQIELEAVTWRPEQNPALVSEGQSRELSRLVPETTLAFYGTGSFKNLWQNTPASVKETIASTVKDLTGLDWQQAFVPWMDGEFAAAFVPVPALGNAPSLLFLSQTGDRPQASQTLSQLDTQIRDRLRWQVQQTATEPQPITTWRIPPGLPVGQHGWLNDQTLFLGLGPLTDMRTPPTRSLADSPLYRAVLPHPKGTQFYLNLSDLAPLQNNLLLPQLAPEIARSLQPFAALGITSRVRDNQFTHYMARIRLKPLSPPEVQPTPGEP
ncbi:DUF3352 domain-containing protein [Thermosynechococcus sp. QS41]|uniref:DUF3352 domain-containing protein n=1 Tax=Thermosynechococcus sp. QS41 TaxID=3074101 RepID=UPI00287765CF|nr:DUF3352 domain-containing protein [Thermosynechococcus sp. QS41]WNC59793.1 DUF3352 domain-containing protein [Thermosynechococcus sp. QS41]